MTQEVAAGTEKQISHRTALLILIAVGLPLLMMVLGSGDTIDMMEQFNLIPAREAVRDGHWLMPTLNGVPRLEKPPMATWLPAVSAKLLGESLWAYRLPAALMGLVTAMAVYGIACVSGRDRKMGLMAAIITLTMIVFLRHARLASYDIFSTGFLTIGAWGLLAMVEAKKRAGWATLAGVGIGLSILSKGPVPVATVCLPLGAWMLVFYRKQAGVWLWLAFAAVVSMIIALPWLVAIGQIYKELNPWKMWAAEILQNSTAVSNNPGQSSAELKRGAHYYLVFFGWVAPHIPMLLAGLALPFVKKSVGEAASESEKRARWAWWVILLGGLVFLTLLAEKKARYAMPLFPFAALLAASAWQEFRRAEGKKADALGSVVLMSQIGFYLVPGLIIALSPFLVGAFNNEYATAFVADASRMLTPVGWIALGILLIVMGLAGIQAAIKMRYRNAGWISLAAMAVFVLAIMTVYRMQTKNNINAVRMPAEDVAAWVGKDELWTLKKGRPWLSALFYLNRPMREDDNQLTALGANHSWPIYFLIVETDRVAEGVRRLREEYHAYEVYRFYDEQEDDKTKKGNPNILLKVDRSDKPLPM